MSVKQTLGVFFISCYLMSISSCAKQEGCIDPNAANYSYDAKKDDGSCLYDMSFWLNTVDHGVVFIYVDDIERGYIDLALYRRPSCGKDSVVYYQGFYYNPTVNVALLPGTHHVRIESTQGTIWEDTYDQPDNCLSILIGS